MDLVKGFQQLNKDATFWQKKERVLLAVSGGVDSMVLLSLFLNLPEQERPEFAVAHFNHQLREESQEEAVYVSNFCQNFNIPCYMETWQVGPLKGNLENQAREARYAFFAKVTREYNFDCLVTGHHADDQAETILMKLTSGSQLHNLVGIRQTSQRGGVVIHRPLLAFSKESLINYSVEKDLVFMEDHSNLSVAYFRNRIRQQIMPQLKAENANFLKHIHNLVKQITYANDIIADSVGLLWSQMIEKVREEEWRVDLQQFRMLKKSQQYLLIVSLLQKTLIVKGIEINEQQVEQVLKILTSSTGYKALSLGDGWSLEKSYDEGLLKRHQAVRPINSNLVQKELRPNQGLFLNTGEWIGLENPRQPLALPKEVQKWHRYECAVTEKQCLRPLMIRQVEAGDRLIYNQAGNSKKVSRIFIDGKIPSQDRWNNHVVCDSNGQLIWIVPIRKSYLSIEAETDKIHYRLIYLKDDFNGVS